MAGAQIKFWVVLAAILPPMNDEPAPGISVANFVQVVPPSVEYPDYLDAPPIGEADELGVEEA